MVRGECSRHYTVPDFQTKYLLCGTEGTVVGAGVVGLTTKRYKRDPEIKNNSLLPKTKDHSNTGMLLPTNN